MKKLIVILSLICLVSGVTAKDVNKPTSAKSAIITLKTNGLDLSHSEIEDYPEHFLGDEIARKYAAIKKVYVRRREVSVGFSNTSVTIVKPLIYNTINKINTYLKKSIKKNSITKEEAKELLTMCLDVVYVAFYEDTDALEDVLKKTKDIDELISILSNVQLIAE